ETVVRSVVVVAPVHSPDGIPRCGDPPDVLFENARQLQIPEGTHKGNLLLSQAHDLPLLQTTGTTTGEWPFAPTVALPRSHPEPSGSRHSFHRQSDAPACRRRFCPCRLCRLWP